MNRSFRVLRKSLETYSVVLHSHYEYARRAIPMKYLKEEVYEILIANPLPVYLRKYRVSNGEFYNPVVTVPLLEDHLLGMKTSMMIWNPESVKKMTFPEKSIHCFQALHPGLIHNISDDGWPITMGVYTTEYSFLKQSNDVKHTLQNITKDDVIVSFHMEMGDEYFTVKPKMESIIHPSQIYI